MGQNQTEELMEKSGTRIKDRKGDLSCLCERADRQWVAGNLRSAFRLFLACAKRGDLGCQVNLGNFYADGLGVKPDRERALYWYRRAYRRGVGAAAFNSGMLFRDENKLKRALAWFERALQLGDADANLEIAKIHLRWNDRPKAKQYLRRACKARPNSVSEEARTEAEHLLAQLLEANYTKT